jgi:hypothetical protein
LNKLEFHFSASLRHVLSTEEVSDLVQEWGWTLNKESAEYWGAIDSGTKAGEKAEKEELVTA